MSMWELFMVAIGVSMDAFAIAICKGLSVEKLEKKHMAITGLWFGGAQALMPLIGVTTFLFSAAGVRIGHQFGAKYKSKAEMAGGIILLVMGVCILLEHTGIL